MYAWEQPLAKMGTIRTHCFLHFWFTQLLERMTMHVVMQFVKDLDLSIVARQGGTQLVLHKPIFCANTVCQRGYLGVSQRVVHAIVLIRHQAAKMIPAQVRYVFTMRSVVFLNGTKLAWLSLGASVVVCLAAETIATAVASSLMKRHSARIHSVALLFVRQIHPVVSWHGTSIVLSMHTNVVRVVAVLQNLDPVYTRTRTQGVTTRNVVLRFVHKILTAVRQSGIRLVQR